MNINEEGEIELADEERRKICDQIYEQGYTGWVSRFGAVYVDGKYYGSVVVRGSKLVADEGPPELGYAERRPRHRLLREGRKGSNPNRRPS